MRTHWPWMSVVYIAMGIAGAGLSYWTNGRNPWIGASHLDPIIREPLSLVTGIVVGLVIVLSTQASVRRFSWARRLHDDLRPVAYGCSNGLLLWMALLSGTSEELVFRSWLGGWIGPIPQAILFALLHQTPGKSRWVWFAWTLVIGLGFAWMFRSIGSLTGAVVAHVVINALNLRFLRDYDVEKPSGLRKIADE